VEYNVSQLDHVRSAFMGANFMDATGQARLHDEVLSLYRILCDSLASGAICLQHGLDR